MKENKKLDISHLQADSFKKNLQKAGFNISMIKERSEVRPEHYAHFLDVKRHKKDPRFKKSGSLYLSALILLAIALYLFL